MAEIGEGIPEIENVDRFQVYAPKELGLEREKVKALINHVNSLLGRTSKSYPLPIDLPRVGQFEKYAQALVNLMVAIDDEVRGEKTERVKLPAYEVRKISGGAHLLLLFAGPLKLREKAERFVESQTEKKIRSEARKMVKLVEVVGEIPNPREEYVKELEKFFNNAISHKSGVIEYLKDTLGDLNEIRRGTMVDSWMKKYQKDFPLLTAAWKAKGLYVEIDENSVPKYVYAAPEMFESIRNFLRSKDVSVDRLPRQPYVGFDRGLVTTIGGGRIDLMKRELPSILEDIYQVLPEDGPAFKKTFIKMIGYTSALKEKGERSIDIVNKMGLLDLAQ